MSETHMQFIRECYRLAKLPDPFILPQKLMNIRKRGDLPKRSEVSAL